MHYDESTRSHIPDGLDAGAKSRMSIFPQLTGHKAEDLSIDDRGAKSNVWRPKGSRVSIFPALDIDGTRHLRWRCRTCSRSALDETY